MSPIARWKRTTTAKQQKEAEKNFATFQTIANSMDGSNAASAAARIAANQQRAMAYLARLPAKSQELIRIAMDNAVYQGTEMDSHAVHVQEGRRWRRAVNLGQWFFPRRLSPRIQEILADRGDPKNRRGFEAMLREMVRNGNAATLTEARDILVSEASNGMSGGEFFGSLDKARGTKLPDSFYDYTFAGYLDHLQGWSKRMAQIHAFGQRMDEEMPPAFMRASQVAEDKSLQSRIRAWYDEIYGQKAELKPAERFVQGYVLPLAAVLYLTGTMTQVRNLASGQLATAENFGYRRLLMADFRAMWDTISALTQMGRNATQGDLRLLEPQLVADAADMGAVKRGLYGVIYDLDENATWAQRLANKVMTPQQMAEMMNRAVTATAALTWLQDAQRAIRANPTSRRSLQAKALMQRWGFDGVRQRELTQSNPRPETVRQFIRQAVNEKQFSYNLTQTPSFMSNNVMTKLLTQFQKWSAQRSRDLHRNVFAPAFAGEVVESQVNGRTVRKRVRTIAPLIRMILSTAGSVALVNAIASALFGRKDRDASWEEIYNTATEDEQRGMQIAVATFLKDMTATGSFGIHWDYFRQIGDTMNPGRRKDLVNPPGFAIVKSVIELAQAQKERGGDPKAFARDVKEILLNKIPVAREAQDFVIENIFDDENYYAMVKQGKEDLAVAKGLLRRYIEETGAELEEYTGRQPKNKNTEWFDRMNEALLIGDLERANEVKQDFLNEGGNLRALKASVQRRAPLVKTGNIRREDEQDFLDWVERRVPSKSAIIEDINFRYHQAAEAIGLENPR
jgi:hypothetical protein